MVSEILRALYSKMELGRGRISKLNKREIIYSCPETWISIPLKGTIIDATLAEREGSIDEKVSFESNIAEIGDTVIKYEIYTLGMTSIRYMVVK